MLLLGGPGVGEPVAHAGTVFFAVKRGVEGLGGAFEAGAAEVVDEEVAGQVVIQVWKLPFWVSKLAKFL